MKFGACFAVPRRAVGLTPKADHHAVELDDGACVRARAVVLAMGVQYRKLPLDQLDEFEGAGVHYAATDLGARFCRDTEAVIVGGGNSAGQAAMFLSRHARTTHILVRGEGLGETMSSHLAERIHSDPAIRLWTRSEVVSLHGGGRLEAVTVRTAEGERRIGTRALFVMIGAAVNTGWLADRVALDAKGFVVTGTEARSGDEPWSDDPFATTLPGVWAVGDGRAGSVKRVASAVGEGSVVVSAVHRHLAAREAAPPLVIEPAGAARG